MVHGSNASENQKNDHDEENQSYSTGRGIAPLPAVRPSWQGPKEGQNQDHDQDSSKHVLLLQFCIRERCSLSRSCTGYIRYNVILIAIPLLGYLRLYR